MYKVLAKHYDGLMRHVDYDHWADYIGGLFDCARITPATVVDLACGTGTLTYMLARRGFTSIGVDSSIDMLACAASKKLSEPVSFEQPIFLRQNLWELDLFGTVDAAVSTLDSFNYITQPEQLRLVFKRVHLFLNPGGVLVFDVRTPKYYEESNGDTFVSESQSCFCAWTPYYVKRDELCTIEINLFERNGQLWRRSHETHRQRCYSEEFLTESLREAGFTDIEAFRPFERIRPEDDERRAFYRAVKQ